MSWQPFLSVIPGSVPADLAIKHISYSDISDSWPMKDQVLEQIDDINQQLVKVIRHSKPRKFLWMTRECDGYATETSSQNMPFINRPALEEWRCQLVPTALSLWSVQHPLAERLISGGEMDINSRAWFIHANDAQGVRSRAKVMSAIADMYINNHVYRQLDKSCLWRCGTCA